MENSSEFTTGSAGEEDNATVYVTSNSLHTLGTHIVICVFFVLLVGCGVFGNMLVCMVVVRRPKMRTVINLFICNLAMSDLLLCIIGVPLTLFGFLKENWVLGLGMCRISTMTTACMVFVSSLTLTTIAVDRFCLVVYPFMKPLDKTKCFITVIVIWVVSIVFSLPLGLQSYVLDFRFMNDGIKCMEFWENIENRKRYAIALFMIQFCYPLVLVSIAHASIAIKLARTTKPGNRRAETDHRENKKRQRMNKMLSSVVFIFAVCWTPLNTYTLLYEYGFAPKRPDLCFILTYYLAVGSAVINPILYAWLNDNFRKEFQKMMPYVPCFRDNKHGNTSKSSNCPTASNIISRADKRSQQSMGTYLQPTCAESSVVMNSTTTVISNERKTLIVDTPM